MTKREAALSWFEGMNSQNVDEALANFTEDGRYWGIKHENGRLVRHWRNGREAIKDYLRPFCEGTLPGSLRYEALLIAETEDTVVVEWSDTAEFDTGLSYSNRGVFLFTCDGEGKIVEARVYYNGDPVKDIHEKGLVDVNA